MFHRFSTLTLAPVLFGSALLGLVGNTQLLGETYYWRAASGLYPNEVDVGMVLTDTAEPANPVLIDGSLVIQTTAPGTDMWYEQHGDQLAMPEQLIIEAELLYVSSNDGKPGRTGTAILFTTAPFVGNVLFIDRGKIFLGAGPDARGPEAVVDTDDHFHLYRIEADNTSSTSGAVRVYQDGVLVLEGSLGGVAADVAWQETIWFGEGTEWSTGTSHWKMFKHNAAVRPSDLAAAIYHAVEIAWLTDMGSTYQVQWSFEAAEPQWVDLGAPVAGTGSEVSVFDRTRDQPKKVYRIVRLP